MVQGYLPVLLVLVLLLVVPIIIEVMATRYVGFKTKSQIQAYVLARHFWFQLLTIFVAVGVLRRRSNHGPHVERIFGERDLVPETSGDLVERRGERAERTSLARRVSRFGSPV